MTSKRARTEAGADDIDKIAKILNRLSNFHFNPTANPTMAQVYGRATLEIRNLLETERERVLDMVEAELKEPLIILWDTGYQTHKAVTVSGNRIDIVEFRQKAIDHTLKVIERLRTSSRPSGSAVRTEAKSRKGKP